MGDLDLPKGWEEAELGAIAVWGAGGTPSRKNDSYYGGDIPWIKTGDLGPRNLKSASEFITEQGLENSSAKIFPKGSVAIAMYGATIGKTSIFELDAATNQACAVANPDNGVDRDFLYYLLNNEKKNFILKGKGGAQPNISQAIIKAHCVGLPPENEQTRIANKLDELLAQVDNIKARVDAIPIILKRFRQSVLAAAVSGKLTEEWRGNNRQECVLKHIENVNAQKQGRLKVRVKKGWDEKLSLFEIPESWSWVSNHKLAKDVSTAICAGPFGTIFKAKDFREEGVPIIFLRHVKEDGFNQRKPNFMDRDVWRELHQDYSIHGGELLVTKLGDPPGECCIYPEDVGTAMVTPDVLKMDVDPAVAEKDYLRSFFNSPVCKDMVRDLAFGVTRLRIDIAMFKSFPIPTPPLEEQKQIVQRVEQFFAFADQAEQRVADAQSRIDSLTQSILAKAFRGELVPQDPNDEPASELLARIQKEREEAAALLKKTKQAAKKTNKKPAPKARAQKT